MLLQKVVYLYECMDNWEKSIEESLPKKEDFYGNSGIEKNTNADYKHMKRVWKEFGIKNLCFFKAIYYC